LFGYAFTGITIATIMLGVGILDRAIMVIKNGILSRIKCIPFTL